MLQKTKLTLLRLFAIVAFIALFVVASFSLASCSSDEKYVVSVTKNDSGVLVVTYSDGTTSELGVVDGKDGEDGDDGVSIKEITYSNGSLIITYNDAAATQEIVDISNLIESNACDHSNSTYLDLSGYTEGVIREATCTETGLTIKYCLDCGNVFVDETAMLPHTLDYSAGTWKLSEDYTTATVTAVCSVCQQEISETTTDVTSTTNKEATCHDAGEVEYTAKITIDGQEYTHTETAVVPATGLHKYVAADGTEYTVQMKTVGGNTYVYINGSETAADYDRLVEVFGEANVYLANCTAGATLLTQNLVCANEGCGEHIYGYADPVGHIESDTPVVENVVAATCTEEGSYDNVYYCTRCGQVVRTEKVTIDKLDHSYVTDATDDANWTWTPVYDTDNTTVLTYTATLTFTCEHCGDTMTQDAVITRVYTEQSCQEAESYTYTATVTYNEVPYIGTYYDELDSKYVIGYHTTNTGVTYVLDSNHFIYAYDTVTGTASTTPLTVSEFLALGGEMTSYGGTNELSYGRITCTTCYNLTGAAAGTDVLNNVTLPEGGHDYANVTDSDVVWTWSSDYTTATATITCDYCGESTDYEAVVTSEANQNGNGTIYTATVTYGLYSWSASVEFLTATVGTEQAVTLSSTATSASYEVAATATGPYAISFSSTEAYIVVTSLYGTYTSYSAPAAVSTLSAKPLEEVATVNYLLDSDGNIAIVPQDAVIYIDVYLYDTTTATDVSAAFTVTEQAIPTVTAGTAYTVTMGADLYSLTTSVTITEAGYYTITATDGAYITVWDDAYTYYYSTRWVEWGYITLGYIVDYAEYDEVPISIPANTTLNVAITYSSDDLTAITVLIAKGDYTPETSGGDDEDTYDYTLTTAGLTEEIEGDGSYLGKAYTIYVSEAGTYTFTVSGDDADIGIAINNETDWSGEVTAILAAGDVVTLYACETGTVTISVKAKETTAIANGGEGDATTNAGSWIEWNSSWTTVSSATIDEDGVVSITYTNNAGYFYDVQLFYENAELTEGTSYDLTITLLADVTGDITINGTVVSLEANVEKTVTITYTEASGASISIQLGVSVGGETSTNLGDDNGAGTFKAYDYSWAEHKEEVAEMVAGTDYTVTLDDTTNYVQTTLTISEAGYYTVSVDSTAVIIVSDDEYNYYYNSNRMTSGYIEDYDNGGVVYIAAGTVLNVTISLIDTSAETEVTALIAIDSSYVPAEEPEEGYYSLGETITATEESSTAYLTLDGTGDYILVLTITSGDLTYSDYLNDYGDIKATFGYVYVQYTDLKLSEDETYIYAEFSVDESDLTYLDKYYNGYAVINLELYGYTGTVTYTVVVSAVEADQGIILTPTLDSVYATGNVRVDVVCEDLDLTSSDYTKTITCESYEGALIHECFLLDSTTNTYRVMVNLSSTDFDSTADVPSFVITWTDADGNVVATATYTPAVEGVNAVVNISELYSADATIEEDTILYEGTDGTTVTVTADSTNTVSVDSNSKSIDGYSFTYRLKLGGTGAADYRSIIVELVEGATITVYAMSSKADNERTLALYDEDYSVLDKTQSNDGNNIQAFTYTVEEGGTYYIASASSGINVYAIVITYTTENTEAE